MKEYRGADGWVNDDGVTWRYQSREDTKPRESASKPKRPKLTSCPNCLFSVRWRREEGHCDHCNWGKKQSDWDSWEPPVTSGDGRDSMLACCGLAGASVVLGLVLMGMGYGFGGFGGMVTGLGLGVVIVVYMTGRKKEK